MPSPKNGFSGKYGIQSKIPPEKSRAEIETMLEQYGADGFQYAIDRRAFRAAIGFRVHGRVVRLVMTLPDPDDPAFTKSAGGRDRIKYARAQSNPAAKAYEQAVRQRWRVLAISVRAKLEAVLCGLATFESEFLGNIVIPGGKTLGEWAKPQIEEAYARDSEPPMLLASTAHLEGGAPRPVGAREATVDEEV
jgi:hypothetical protein